MTIPEFLRCSLSKQILMDPYTTEAGYSYEHTILEKYVKQNGPKDPLT
jgi:hypothetical protein